MLQVIYLRKIHWFIRLLTIVFIFIGVWLVIGYYLPRVLPSRVLSDTSRRGLILRDEKWSGVMRVTGDIWSLPGATVIILPGTKIVVSDSDKSNMHWLPWQLRAGLNTGEENFGVKAGKPFLDERKKINLLFAKLYALGTKEQPIIIESDTSRPGSPYDFNTVSVTEGILSYIQLSNYRRFEVGNKVTVRDSEFKNVGECAICVKFTSPTIANNIFSSALGEYVWVAGGSPRINDNLFKVSESTGDGIVVDPQEVGAPTIYHNTFEMPGKVAIRFINGGEELGGSISLNNFVGGSTIVIPCDSRVKIVQNEIKGVIRLANSGNCVGSLVLGPNYWNSKDRLTILREKIIGREANFSVLLPTILNSSPSGAGRRSN